MVAVGYLTLHTLPTWVVYGNLDAILLKQRTRQLTNDVPVSLMAEVTAILNNQQLVPVSIDPSNPLVLTPNRLLTQKTEADLPPFHELDVRDMYVSSWK